VNTSNRKRLRRRRVFVIAAALIALAITALPAAAGTLDQAQTSFGSAKGYIGTWDGSGTPILQAQTFTSSATGMLDRVDLPLRVVGNPAVSLTVEIRTTAGGEPTSTVLGSAVVSQTSVPAFGGPASDFGTFGFLPIPLSTPASVAAGSSYAIVLGAAGSAATVYDPDPNRYEWAGISGDPYVAGHHVAIVGGILDPDVTPVDLAFKTYVAQPATVHFLQPLDESTDSAIVTNEGSNSRTIPIKIQLTADGAPITGDGSPGPTVTLGTPTAIACAAGAVIDSIETYTSSPAAGSLTFAWNSSGFWQLNLDVKTLNLTIGSCYRFDVYVDGTKVTNAFAVYRPKSK
jgi:hypothetical protein